MKIHAPRSLSRRPNLRLLCVVLCGAALLVALSANAQSTAPPSAVPQPAAASPAAAGAAAPSTTPPASAPLTPEQQRHNQIATDSARLYQLANELKAEMDKSTKDTLSLTVIKKAQEVEKLAHKVRDEIRASLVAGS